MSGSKTVYYVSSSCCPIFDPDSRINQYEAAMLDYTANSPIELSEYMKIYYNTSRLRNFRGYLNWCDREGFTKEFGQVESDFYGDAKISNDVLTEILSPILNPSGKGEFKVYNNDLTFFSEDFYIKYLATQQGHAEWVYQDRDTDYEITYPTDQTIKATFKDGRVIEGTLPTYKGNTRFLEVSYSIYQDTPSGYDPVTGEPLTEGIRFDYGFYQYKEKSGIPDLDAVITAPSVLKEDSFFPVIPLRTNTSWYTGERADMISSALEYLEIIKDPKQKTPAYETFKKFCVEGMKEGSMGDIDYITLLLGVSIISDHKADLAYIYEFFYNLHINYAIKTGVDPSKAIKPKELSLGLGFLWSFASKLIDLYKKATYTDSYFVKFAIRCASTNLNLTYTWAGSDYFEANGQFKPDAKPGDYGVQAGTFIYEWEDEVPKIGKDGKIEFKYNGKTHKFEVVTIKIKRFTPYSLTLFCKQTSVNRWRFVMYVDMNMNNLIYHGKSINTTPIGAIQSATETKTVTHDFTYDDPKASHDLQHVTLSYVTVPGDLDTAFIVPLEKNTFYEVGARNTLEISYGSQFLLFNCWVKKKKKWYQRGFFSVVFAFVGITIGTLLAPISLILGTVVITYFATALVMIVSGIALETTLKLLQCIFGDHLGTEIYNFFRSLVGVVCAIVGKIPVIGWIIAGIIMFSVTSGEALNNGESLWSAFKKGVIAGTMAAGASYIGGAAGTAAESAAEGAGGFLSSHSAAIGLGVSGAVSGTINGFGGAYLATGSLSKALKQGLISGISAGAVAFIGAEISDFLQDQGLISKAASSTAQESTEVAKDFVVSDYLASSFKSEFLENPFTYAKLIGISLDEINFHKLANLENDYQEFTNQYASALKALEILQAKQNDTLTAEFVCKLQSCLGRLLTTMPEMLSTMTPDSFFKMSLAVGSDQIKASLGIIPTYVDSKLTIDGYSPSPLHYSATNYTLTWDN